MTEESPDKDYFDLFKPKPDKPSERPPEGSESRSEEVSSANDATLGPPEEPVTAPGDVGSFEATVEEATPAEGESWDAPELDAESAEDVWYVSQPPEQATPTIQTLGAVAGAGCLLLMLTAVVVFAFVQVFVRRGDDEVQVTFTPTQLAVVLPTASPTAVGVPQSPTVAPLVSSTDVQVMVALPERLIVGGAVFPVQAEDVAAGSWPTAPETDDTASWAFGTLVNFVFSLAPTPENRALISGLETGDAISLDMSTGIMLNFSVSAVTTGAGDEAFLLSQTSPRLTLALLAGDPSQRVVLTAPYFDDEPRVIDEAVGAAIGLVGTPIVKGPVRVTVLENYIVAGGQAGLPGGTGYVLLDVTVENIGTEVLEPRYFQTFLSAGSGNRYPLTFAAEQYAHYGFPTEPLGPGETVIGSYGYLVTANLQGEFRWVFNPQPASENWVLVPISADLPPIAPTPQPTPVAGFAVVTVQTNDVFVNRDDGVLDIMLRVENTSGGVVRITADDISLTSFSDGELTLVAPAPPLPWMIEPGELKLFQLQYQIPSSNSALLTVQGYSFSIENLGGE
jgi:hypothetical protein